MTDDRVETHVTIADPDAPGQLRAVHFQEYWVRLRAHPEALAVTLVGLETARPAPGVIEALEQADLILVAPSNPVVSIGPILAVPGLRDAVQRAPAPVVGFAGILGGAPVLGMAHRLLPAIGVDVDAAAVGSALRRPVARRRTGCLGDGYRRRLLRRARPAGRVAGRRHRSDHARPGEHGRLRQLRDQIRHVMIGRCRSRRSECWLRMPSVIRSSPLAESGKS